MLDPLKQRAEHIRSALQPQNTPEPDVFDLEIRPFGTRAGENNFGFLTCATCGKSGSFLPDDYRATTQMPTGRFFLFCDELSAQEYRISGMCQACQDSVFKAEEP